MEAPHLKCSQCDYHAGDAYSLRIHQRKHDTTAARFHCQHPGCDRSYTTLGHLNEHTKQHRTSLCPNCGKIFTVSSGLKSHLLSCSPDGQPLPKKFKCDVCDKAYYRSGEMARHRGTRITELSFHIVLQCITINSFCIVIYVDHITINRITFFCICRLSS